MAVLSKEIKSDFLAFLAASAAAWVLYEFGRKRRPRAIFSLLTGKRSIDNIYSLLPILQKNSKVLFLLFTDIATAVNSLAPNFGDKVDPPLTRETIQSILSQETVQKHLSDSQAKVFKEFGVDQDELEAAISRFSQDDQVQMFMSGVDLMYKVVLDGGFPQCPGVEVSASLTKRLVLQINSEIAKKKLELLKASNAKICSIDEVESHIVFQHLSPLGFTNTLDAMVAFKNAENCYRYDPDFIQEKRKLAAAFYAPNMIVCDTQDADIWDPLPENVTDVVVVAAAAAADTLGGAKDEELNPASGTTLNVDVFVDEKVKAKIESVSASIVENVKAAAQGLTSLVEKTRDDFKGDDEKANLADKEAAFVLEGNVQIPHIDLNDIANAFFEDVSLATPDPTIIPKDNICGILEEQQVKSVVAAVANDTDPRGANSLSSEKRPRGPKEKTDSLDASKGEPTPSDDLRSSANVEAVFNSDSNFAWCNRVTREELELMLTTLDPNEGLYLCLLGERVDRQWLDDLNAFARAKKNPIVVWMHARDYNEKIDMEPPIVFLHRKQGSGSKNAKSASRVERSVCNIKRA